MLRFCFGASGAGKSTGIFEEVIDRSFKEPEKDFLIIVPDQFTMQTQKDVVRMHPSHAIMNIDVLSFGRLSHRIFEEVGLSSFSVLDDVGKSLILRRVAELQGDKLPVIGPNMHKSGYIDEVKSTISEFMMYGIGDKELETLEEKSRSKGALCSKIKDLRLLYREFLKYIEGKYITTEETLDILCTAISKSNIIKNSVIVFDGFTGFTPIQYRVIKRLLENASEVIVSVTISPKENPYDTNFEEQELFMLSKKTVRDLERLCSDNPQNYGKRDRSFDIRIDSEPVVRLKANPSLSFLEENLFRYNAKQYSDVPEGIEIFQSSTPAQEVRQAMIKISGAVLNDGYAYRDIAIVCGSLEEYADILSKTAEKFRIPVYIDQNTNLLLNPFIEYITSAINIAISGYKYEDVFHYMRSGMTGFSREDTDILENYVRALGIRGKKQWEDRFSRRMPKRFKRRGHNDEDNSRDVELMEKLESMRASISSQLAPLFTVTKASASDITDALIKVIDDNNCNEKLLAYKEMFEKDGNLKKAREYDQVYDKIMTLLEQIKGLIGEDVLELSEYLDILNAGFSEIEVGTIPQDVDRIIIGDIERTRLKEVKLLFFLGAGDGYIPKSAGSGGILSDIDRQYLMELDADVELAPTPRQQMYIQRLYLYMNLTKPTDKLFLSYPELSADGKSLRPAYLVPKLLQMFPALSISRPEDGDFESQNVAYRDSLENTADMLRTYALGNMDEKREKELYTLISVLSGHKEENQAGELSEARQRTIDRLIDAAFAHYESKPLAKAIATSLYGASLEMSVSRMELFASCAYSHFLRYGMGLTERDEYEFDFSDLGNVFHNVLEKYTSEIMKKKLSFRNLSKDESDEILKQALISCTDEYGETILHDNARNEYMTTRIYRILARTVDTLRYQISKGRFEPAFVEMDFSEAGNIEEINVSLSEKEKIKLRGRIDRVDLYEDENNVYVKVIDFKSGKKSFSIASLYHGLQLQLVMYMNVAVAAQKKLAGNKDVLPAAILYYHVDDPLVEGTGDSQPDDIDKAIREKLKTTGLVNDNMDIIQMLDEGLSGKSDVIPVALKKDGSLTSNSQTISEADYSALRAHVNTKIREFGRRILDGEIAVNPYSTGTRESCTYCAYKAICGYDERIPGYSKRMLNTDEDAAMEAIRQEHPENN